MTSSSDPVHRISAVARLVAHVRRRFRRQQALGNSTIRRAGSHQLAHGRSAKAPDARPTAIFRKRRTRASGVGVRSTAASVVRVRRIRGQGTK